MFIVAELNGYRTIFADIITQTYKIYGIGVPLSVWESFTIMYTSGYVNVIRDNFKMCWLVRL
jgi:hypothetical protein